MTTPPLESLASEAARMQASGVFARSERLRGLFDYLLECTLRGRTPKEIDIAIEALGRGPTFDVTQDAMVRVYVHKLRRLLDDYYAGAGSNQRTRIIIAKGEYRLALEPLAADAAGPILVTEHPPAPVPSSPSESLATPSLLHPPRARRLTWIAAALCLSLVINGLLAVKLLTRSSHANAISPGSAYPVWKQMLHEDRPVIIALGDYYIFGETDHSEEVQRMVREFSVNSRRDLEQFSQTHPQQAEHYLDLDLTYLPTSVGPALQEILPALADLHKHVQVILVSDLTTSMLTSADIIYVGYLSGLGRLRQIVFSGSSFSVGDNYDELVSRVDRQRYVSQGGNPWRGNQKYTDYGYLSTFAGPTGNRFVIISGARDAAVAGVADALATPGRASLPAVQSKGGSDFEALYEVYGVGHTHVGMKLVRLAHLNTEAIWKN